MTEEGKQSIINRIEGWSMFDKKARDYVIKLIKQDIKDNKGENKNG